MKEKILKVEHCCCPICDKEHDVILKEKEITVEIKGVKVPYIETVYFCENADDEECEYCNGKMLDENLDRARKAYKEIIGAL